MQLVKRRYIEEILDDLRYKDSRSAIRWCERNNLTIRKDGVRNYVVENEFIQVYNNQNLLRTKNVSHELSKSSEMTSSYKPQSKLALELSRALLK